RGRYRADPAHTGFRAAAGHAALADLSRDCTHGCGFHEITTMGAISTWPLRPIWRAAAQSGKAGLRAGAGRGEVDPGVDHLEVRTRDHVDVRLRLAGAPIRGVDSSGGLVLLGRPGTEVDGGDHVGPA